MDVHCYEAAIKKAKEEGKSVLLDFETVWCGPRRVMNALEYTADTVADLSEDRVFVKVDADESALISNK